MHAVRLTFAGADLDVVGKASLGNDVNVAFHKQEGHATGLIGFTYPHGSVQRPRDFVILLEAGTAAQDLRKPELPNRAFHVLDLALRWWRCLYPLRWFPAHATDHVCMSKRLGRFLASFHAQRRWEWLSNA